MRADVLPQVAERGKVLGASLRLAVERLPRVQPLVGFQSAHDVEEEEGEEGSVSDT